MKIKDIYMVNEKNNVKINSKVCLVNTASRANSLSPPLGLMYIAAYLEKNGIEVDIVDIKRDFYSLLTESHRKIVEDEILEEIIKIKPELIGIGCLVTEVEEVINLSKRIKEKLRDTLIIVGGIHASMYPGDLLFLDSPIDYVVIGEGEQTVNELVQVACKGGTIAGNVKGVAWFDGFKVQKTIPRPPIKYLDEIPFPLYKKVDFNYYFKPNIYAIRNMLLSTAFIFTSRGCPYHCSFCVNKNIQKIMGSSYSLRSRSVINVVDEIEYLNKEFNIDGFYIYDDCFCINKHYTLDFCKEILKRKLRLIWAAETRVNLVSEELIKAMKDAGCVQLDFGVESGSPEILKRLQKGITVRQIRDAFQWCHKLGIRCMANFMMNTPGETKEDIEKNLALAKEINANYYNFTIMTPYPGTDIYECVSPKLSVKEYPLLIGGIRKLMDPRFKYANHDLDLCQITYSANRSLNSLFRRASFILNKRYLWQIMRSKRKIQYLLSIGQLLKRMIRYLMGETI